MTARAGRPRLPPASRRAVGLGGAARDRAAGWARSSALGCSRSRAGLDPLLVGAAFGGALGALVLAGRGAGNAHRGSDCRAGHRSSSRCLSGRPSGLVLVAVAVVGPAIGGATPVPGLGRPAAPFVPWALITLLVAAAEEGVLRGVLFDRLERLAGLCPPSSSPRSPSR